MFFGPLLSLPPSIHLSALLARASSAGDTIGAWVHCGSPLHIYQISPRRLRVLASGDLGFLLRRCHRVAVREGPSIAVLRAETVIQWRALQVVTMSPCLPGIDRLRAMFPGLQLLAEGPLLPLSTRSPEEALAGCLAEGIQVTASRVVYSQSR